MRSSWLLLLISVGAGCSAESGAFLRSAADEATTDYTDGVADTDAGEPGTSTEPPEAPEDEFALRPPAQTDVFVFVANPDRNTVTRVNVRTLEVDTTPAGVDPQIVLTTADYRTAVVFNRGDETVLLLDAQTLDRFVVPVRSNMNDMVLSPDGAYAVLWHNKARERPDDPVPEGLQSFNEASFVNVQTGEHFPMAVGFNPRMVRFTPDGTLAVVVADAYVATVDLTVSEPFPTLIELEPDVLSPPRAEEVIVARDGSFAWVRQFGATDLLTVDLVSGDVARVPAGTNPTDLDLSHDGTQAIAVARGSSELWVYEADAPEVAPVVLPYPASAPYGSLLVDPSGDQAFLYSTATLSESYAVWDRFTDEIRERDLVKPVRNVAVNPTGETLMIFHTEEDGPDTDPLFVGSWGLTLVELATLRTNPLRLPAEPTEFANGTDGSWGFFIMEDEPFLEVLDYTTLLHTEFELRSTPEFVGVLPDLDPADGDAPPAWVSQEHPLGRISFYDPDTDALETLTGFELNSEIE